MAKNRYVNTHFWDDNYVMELDPSEKLLFLYFLTNPLTNIAGCYEISLKLVALHTGYDKDMIVKILARFEKDNKIIYRDGWLLLVNSLKHQALNPNIEKGIEESLQNAPEWIKLKVINELKTFGKGFERLYKALKYLILSYSILSNSNEPRETPVGDVPEENPNSAFESETEKFMAEIRAVYKSNILDREDRWIATVEKTIAAEIPVEGFIKELKTLLTDKSRKFNLTPENVLTAAIEKRAKNSFAAVPIVPPPVTDTANLPGLPPMKRGGVNQNA